MIDWSIGWLILKGIQGIQGILAFDFMLKGISFDKGLKFVKKKHTKKHTFAGNSSLKFD